VSALPAGLGVMSTHITGVRLPNARKTCEHVTEVKRRTEESADENRYRDKCNLWSSCIVDVDGWRNDHRSLRAEARVQLVCTKAIKKNISRGRES